MPLLFHKKLHPEGELGLWQIEENEDFFRAQLDLHLHEALSIQKMKGHRRLEWLAARFLLHNMSKRKQRGACLKDEFGKPYLENSLFDISISHSRKIAAVMAAPRSVGVDIQKIVSKIERIAHKYMRVEESESLEETTRLEHLHVYWGAKEALYKAHGRRQLDFREHIFIDPFSYNLKNASCTGRILKDDFTQKYLIQYEKIDDYILVQAMEDIGDVRISMGHGFDG